MKLAIIAVAALASLAMAAGATAAPVTTTFDFDNLGVNTTVDHLAGANPNDSVDFVPPQDLGFTVGSPGDGVVAGAATCGPPIVRTVNSTQSPPNYASRPCGSIEIRQGFGTFGVLGDTANRLSAFVGDPHQFSGGSTTFELDAYDVSNQLIARQTVTTTASDIRTPLTVSRPPGLYDIASFALWVSSPTPDAQQGFDDLSFVTDPTVAPPQISLATSAGGQLAQGGSVQYRVSLFRHNGSNGNVDLAVDGLPSSVHGSFNPPTIAASGTTGTLTVGADAFAPLGPATGTITATPGAGAGNVIQHHTLSLQIVPPFAVYVGVDTTQPSHSDMTVPACGSSSTAVRTFVAPGFTGTPIKLGWTTNGDTRGITSISLSRPSLGNPGDFPFSENDQQLTVTRNDYPTTASAFQVQIEASSGLFVAPAATVNVTLESPRIDSITPTALTTPQALHLGTKVTLKGSGFCPGDKVRFGNPQATASPDTVSPDTATMTVTTPPLATSGPLSIVRSATSPGGGQVTSQVLFSPTATVDSYRNINGYSFANYTPHITFDQMTQAFGSDQTYDSVALCIFGCKVSFRDPFAMTLNAIANAAFESAAGGACFGFSLSSQRFLEGFRDLHNFAPGDSNSVYGLIGPPPPGSGQPDMGSGPIVEYINAMQVSMLSYEFLGHWLDDVGSHLLEGGAAASHDVYNQITGALAEGHYPLIALWDGGSNAHVVVAYNVEGAPPDWYVDVYDSNVPFDSSEVSGTAHQLRALASRIHVDSDGNWALPSTNNMSGSMPFFVVTDPANLPDPPSMVGSGLITKFLTLGFVLFGSGGAPDTTGTSAVGPAPSTVTQVSDSSGQTLFDQAGKLNADPKTRLAGAPLAPFVSNPSTGAGSSAARFILLPRSASTIHETVADTGSGPDTHTVLGHGFAAQLDTRAGAGAVDHLTIGPNGAAFSTSAASKPLGVTLIDSKAETRRTAEVRTTTFRGPGDRLALAGDGLELQHHGKATTFTLTLSALGPRNAPQTFKSGVLHVGAGQTARISGIRWGSLARSAIRVTMGGRTRMVRNRFHAPRLASIGSLRARKMSQRAIALTINARLTHLPRGAQLAFAWTIRDHGRTVGSHLVLEPTATRSATYVFHPRHTGRYTLTAAVSVATVSGVAQSSSVVVRKLPFKA